MVSWYASSVLIPGQTPDMFLSDVSEAVRLGVAHVSVYPLSIEEGTPFDRLVEEHDVLDHHGVIAEQHLGFDGLDIHAAYLDGAGIGIYFLLFQKIQLKK